MDGSGSGIHTRGSAGAQRGAVSSSTVSRLMPARPSTMQWCTFEISAQRPSGSPSASHTCHGDRVRSSRPPSSRPASACSSAGPPGGGPYAHLQRMSASRVVKE